MKFTIVFKWHRDESWESIADDFDSTQDVLDKLLKENEDAITPRVLRDIYHKMRDENDRKSGKILSEFLSEMHTEDGMTMPRYAHYIKTLLEYGPYELSKPRKQQPITQESYQKILKAMPDDFDLRVCVNIPDNLLPEEVDFFSEIIMQQETLADGMWEGEPGSEAVYYNGAVIGFNFYKN